MGGRMPVPVPRSVDAITDAREARAYADAAVKASYSVCSLARPKYQEAANQAQALINQGFDGITTMTPGSEVERLKMMLRAANHVCDTQRTKGTTAAQQPQTVDYNKPAAFDPPSAAPVQPEPAPSAPPPQSVYVPKAPTTTPSGKPATLKAGFPWWAWAALAFGGVWLAKDAGKKGKGKKKSRKRRRR